MKDLMNAIKGDAVLQRGGDPAAQTSEIMSVEKKKPLTDLSLIESITEYMSDGYSNRGFRPGIHPSEIAYEDPLCPRWHIYRQQLVIAQQHKKPLPFGVVELQDPEPNPGLMRIFAMGHSVHALYQDDILGPAGVLFGFWKRWNDKTEKWEQSRGFRPDGSGWKYTEPKIRTKGVTGQCDGIVLVEGRWFVLEIKSSNDQAFRFRKKVKHEHLRQAQVYANLGFVDFPEIDVEGIIFLYVNKNTNVEKEFIVPKDTQSILDILKGLDAFAEAEKSKSLPPRQCLRANSKRANQCPVKSHCFDTGHGQAAYIQITEPPYS